ncbi:unnamed protein product [Thelazia callipaeda]|uniref:DUF4371 domain-containing protein n=1 Tax=Thelazia callipaeda TaxID=103827 RepID=A0A0N5CXL8_THECL|nr:unnamed protein product [Thelazia callipaeda]
MQAGVCKYHRSEQVCYLYSFELLQGYRCVHSFDRQRRLELFRNEQYRQVMAYEQSVTKVFWTIEEQTRSDTTKVLMNHNISTYRDCIKHLSRLKADRIALAYVNGSYKSMREKLLGNGTMTPLEYNCQDKLHADAVNKACCHLRFKFSIAYWRTCSFVLGAILEEAFATDVQLIGPSKGDLFALTEKAVGEFIRKPLTIEPLFVSLEFALDVFASNVCKQEMVHEMKHQNENGQLGVVIYQMSDFVDITYGPLIPCTAHIGKFAITKVENEKSDYRFIGVSIPRELRCSSYSWDIICNASTVTHGGEERLLHAST